MTRQQLERAGAKAVRELRKNTLKEGIPFMINTPELPSHQCYYEYPDGSMQLAALSDTKMDIIIIRELTSEEVKALRKKYHLLKQ